MASMGTPAVACVNGTVTRVTEGGKSAGKYFRLTMDGSSTFFYYMHMQDITVSQGQRVSAGDLVGHVGDTGNARGGAPHIHFEVHPNGGERGQPLPAAQAVRPLTARLTRLRYFGAFPGVSIYNGDVRTVHPGRERSGAMPGKTVAQLGEVWAKVRFINHRIASTDADIDEITSSTIPNALKDIDAFVRRTPEIKGYRISFSSTQPPMLGLEFDFTKE